MQSSWDAIERSSCGLLVVKLAELWLTTMSLWVAQSHTQLSLNTNVQLIAPLCRSKPLPKYRWSISALGGLMYNQYFHRLLLITSCGNCNHTTACVQAVHIRRSPKVNSEMLSGNI